jgi:hypothetical protein
MVTLPYAPRPKTDKTSKSASIIESSMDESMGTGDSMEIGENFSADMSGSKGASILAIIIIIIIIMIIIIMIMITVIVITTIMRMEHKMDLGLLKITTIIIVIIVIIMR